MKQHIRILNKKWWFAGLMAAVVINTGCQKSFLDVDVQGQVPAAQLWQTQTDATNAVNAIYAHLRVWNNVAFAPLCVESVASDDAVKGSTPSDAAFINNYDNFSVTATDGQLNDFWIGQYQNINLCNQVLDSIQQIQMDATLKARYNAESKFIRAYSYFRLLRAYGHIPLVLHIPHTNAELNPVQSATADVWSAIETDLTDAAAVLPQSYPATDVGHATKGAALGMHAKVAMYQKKWDQVLDYSNQVMALGYSLFPNYYQSFRIENENNSESVFEIQSNFVANNADLSNTQYSQIQGDKDVAGVGWGFNIPTQDLVNAFEPGDPRLPGTVMFTGTTTPSGDAVPPPQSVQARQTALARVSGQMLHDVLDHHHGGVHQHPECDGQAAQAHQVGRHTGQAHQDEGGERCQRQHHGHGDGRAHIAEKGTEQHQYDQRRLEQGL